MYEEDHEETRKTPHETKTFERSKSTIAVNNEDRPEH